MKKKSPLLWLIPLIVLLLLIPFIVPSALPCAEAEESDIPAYSPVVLANTSPDPLPLPQPKGAGAALYAPHPDGYTYDENNIAWEYLDGTLSVRIERRVISGTRVFFTWVQVADPTQFQTACTTFDTAPDRWCKKVQAVIGINGDWFIERGEGIIYRNAVQLRKKSFGNYDALLIDDAGDFHILCRPSDDAFAPYEGHIMHSFLFGPALVVDGVRQTYEGNNYGSGPGMGLQKKAQRQAICQMDKLSYLIVTTEGPNESKDGGFTMDEFAQIVSATGAVNAYNLDGGNSASLVMNNVRVNRLGKSNSRSVFDLLYFVSAEPAPEPAPAAESTLEEGSTEP